MSDDSATTTTVSTGYTPALVFDFTKLAKLREPFPPEKVGKLPRGGVELDYVGHGAVTDRLLEVDPRWDWEPLAFDSDGLPLFVVDADGNPIGLWIQLTVCGVTRLGFGSCGPKQFDPEKVLIGDAIRNAAMRFGVALDLWMRGHAEDDEQAAAADTRKAPKRRTPPPPPTSEPPASDEQVVEFANLLGTMDAEEIEALRVYFHEQQIPRIAQASRDQAEAGIAEARRVIAVRHEPEAAS